MIAVINDPSGFPVYESDSVHERDNRVARGDGKVRGYGPILRADSEAPSLCELDFSAKKTGEIDVNDIDRDRRSFYVRVLDTLRWFQTNIPGGADAAMVAIAAGLGRIDGSPMSVSDIAHVTGFSRPKVHRLVTKLEHGGWVTSIRAPGRTWIMPFRHNESPEKKRALDEVIADVNERACRHYARCNHRNAPLPATCDIEATDT